jgi:hypothetical protein
MPALKTITLSLGLLLAVGATAHGADPRLGMPTAASQYFAGSHVMAPNQPLHRPAATPQPMEEPVGGKPFQALRREPTLSPYLALDMLNDVDTGLPNYHAYYRPMRQQQEANAAQEARLRRMQQQLHVANSTGAAKRNLQGGMPTTGTSTQFMNLGGYFPGLR